MDEYKALGVALGHVRNATAAFLAVDDPSGESLFLAAECVDLEGMFAQLSVVPEFVEGGLEGRVAGSSRGCAGVGREVVPLGVWVALAALQARAAR